MSRHLNMPKGSSIGVEKAVSLQANSNGRKTIFKLNTYDMKVVFFLKRLPTTAINSKRRR